MKRSNTLYGTVEPAYTVAKEWGSRLVLERSLEAVSAVQPLHRRLPYGSQISVIMTAQHKRSGKLLVEGGVSFSSLSVRARGRTNYSEIGSALSVLINKATWK